MSPRFIIITSVLLLILTKTVNLFHFDTPQGYWDLDRLFGLAIFLVVAHKLIEPLKPNVFAVMLFIFVSAYGIDQLSSQLGFERIIQLLVLTALVEEILLRGVLFELLLKKLAPLTTLIATSVFFTAVHPLAYSDLSYVIALLVSGLMLGGSYLYYRKQSLQKAILVATGLHMVIILVGVNVGMIE